MCAHACEYPHVRNSTTHITRWNTKIGKDLTRQTKTFHTRAGPIEIRKPREAKRMPSKREWTVCSRDVRQRAVECVRGCWRVTDGCKRDRAESVKISAGINKAESSFRITLRDTGGTWSSRKLLLSFVHDRVSYFASSASMRTNLLCPTEWKIKKSVLY